MPSVETRWFHIWGGGRSLGAAGAYFSDPPSGIRGWPTAPPLSAPRFWKKTSDAIIYRAKVRNSALEKIELLFPNAPALQFSVDF